MMKRRGGIVRNKIQLLRETKRNNDRKKSRFHIYSDTDDGDTTDRVNLIGLPGSNSTLIIESVDANSSESNIEYVRAKKSLEEVALSQNKIKVLSRKRLMTFKDQEIQRLDQSIHDSSATALKQISSASQVLHWLQKTTDSNPFQEKVIRNLEKSLAFEIREAAKSLRQQEKQLFNGIKNYQKESHNPAVQLSEEQNQLLQDEMDDGEMFQQLQRERDQQINKLVTSINSLSTIYKEMNELVINQGSLIDRIDCNLQVSVQRTKKGVQHLKKAEQHQKSPLADRIIKAILGLILVLTVALGYKYSCK